MPSEASEQDHLGALLAASAMDTPPHHTEPDTAPTPGSPLDAALAVLHSAMQQTDAKQEAELRELYAARQDGYRTAINGIIDSTGGAS
jgi:hypothetical protein